MRKEKDEKAINYDFSTGYGGLNYPGWLQADTSSGTTTNPDPGTGPNPDPGANPNPDANPDPNARTHRGCRR